ncbi:hypothetical protein, partial [Fischerella thermalis]|uniref:hypothetical protein n=1 Tax=Fischerella thermalis TaxID=372787 RepID=UPI00307E44F9
CGCKSGESDVFWEGEHRCTRMNTDGLSVCICVHLCSSFIDFVVAVSLVSPMFFGKANTDAHG